MLKQKPCVQNLKHNSPLLYKRLKLLYYFICRHSPFISKKYFHLSKNNYFDLSTLKKEAIGLNFLVIGAQRSGTTALHNYLSYHPSIFTSNPLKEPAFCLSEIPRWQKAINQRIPYAYHSRFDLLKNYMLQQYNGEPAVGESSTYYTMNNFSEKYHTPKRIYAYNPQMKLIYLLRHPIERIISNYLQGDYDKTYPTLDAFVQQFPESVRTSSYAYQLRKFLQYFDYKQIKIIIFEEFIHNPLQTVQDISGFLGLPPMKKSNDFKPVNATPHKAGYPEEKLRFSPGIFFDVASYFEKEREQLEELTGMDFSFWNLQDSKYILKNKPPA